MLFALFLMRRSGGESIRHIIAMSGARIDFDKMNGDNPVERFFQITGCAALP